MQARELLTTPGLVQSAPTLESIYARADAHPNTPVRIFYGETYDGKGHTVDSMKYYLYANALATALEQEGIDTVPTILVADTAACRNVDTSQVRHTMRLGAERSMFVEQVNGIYGGNLTVERMSDFIDAPDFIERRQEIIDTCMADPSLLTMVEESVPISKRDIERNKGFLYSYDEITTIMNVDIKVGPPREDLYDRLARTIADRQGSQGVTSLFLTPAFPLGKNWGYFYANPGIEDHGITAYKAGSKQLQDYRIRPGQTDPDEARRLIDTSFISLNPQLPNPVLELGMICELAERQLTGSAEPITMYGDYYDGRINQQQLKQRVGDMVETVILAQFS